MSEPAPLVTVVVPARDEQTDIGDCLDLVLEQTWPRDRLEVVLVDGASSDATAELARLRLEPAGLHRWAIASNPAATTPSNLNVGLRWAQGEYVVRVDARSRVPADYVERCVGLLAERPDVAVVGGSQVSQAPPDGDVWVRGIVRAQHHPYGMGGAAYRKGRRSGPADTVYLGAFRRSDLEAVGGWDERFSRNQDFELNQRLAERGQVWFEAGLEVGYVPRRTLRALWRQYLQFGRWKAAAWLEGGVAVQPRQKLMLMAPVAATFMAVVGPRVPAVPTLTGLAVVVAYEVSHPRPAEGVAERLTGLVAANVMIDAWLVGVALQATDHVRGRRLIGAAATLPE